MKTYNVVIEVKQIAKKLSDHEDRLQNPKGTYAGIVKAKNKKDAKEMALDEFHETIPIGCLDDFDINIDVEKI